MKTWNVRLAVLLGVTLVAVLAALAVAGPMRFIRMPEGVWLWVRTPGAIQVAGGRYRYFIWGTDTVVRVELDTDGDGRYDVRGDDWQRVTPTWCWRRGSSGWEPAAPEHCVAAREQLTPGPR
ncbi:hypothetical protein [Pyxidicoccus xibeiensis]|uniref:hypothetical protein n=1 Tax=Pyxidicoccus xibeiensis TaxID=2906759 RepID=UPI0020A7284F|nr:hypothetical protein [Pyxidicoccus xibeiensis]MCP3144725.1 hypothetical protein [Pyxidicoccus xibeiensis]